MCQSLKLLIKGADLFLVFTLTANKTDCQRPDLFGTLMHDNSAVLYLCILQTAKAMSASHHSITMVNRIGKNGPDLGLSLIVSSSFLFKALLCVAMKLRQQKMN